MPVRSALLPLLILLGGLSACALPAGSAGQAGRAAPARAVRTPVFTTVALGTAGGLDESSLTAFLLGPIDGSSYVALDAGTLHAGLQRAIRRGSFRHVQPPAGSRSTLAGHLLRERIRAVFISHPHLDHLAGLVIASPDDAAKPLLALPSTHEAMARHLWQSPIWVNFTDEGPGALGKLRVVRLSQRRAEPIPGTPFTARAFPLAHGTLTSTALLLEQGGQHVLYLGDTGPDAVEGGGRLAALWTEVAPLIRQGRLRAIYLECSYPDPRPEKLLFGHLTPRWILAELAALARRVDPAQPDEALRALTLFVTHIKPSLERGSDPRSRIIEQLAPLQGRLRVIVPEPGARYDF